MTFHNATLPIMPLHLSNVTGAKTPLDLSPILTEELCLVQADFT